MMDDDMSPTLRTSPATAATSATTGTPATAAPMASTHPTILPTAALPRTTLLLTTAVASKSLPTSKQSSRLPFSETTVRPHETNEKPNDQEEEEDDGLGFMPVAETTTVEVLVGEDMKAISDSHLFRFRVKHVCRMVIDSLLHHLPMFPVELVELTVTYVVPRDVPWVTVTLECDVRYLAWRVVHGLPIRDQSLIHQLVRNSNRHGVFDMARFSEAHPPPELGSGQLKQPVRIQTPLWSYQLRTLLWAQQVEARVDQGWMMPGSKLQRWYLRPTGGQATEHESASGSSDGFVSDLLFDTTRQYIYPGQGGSGRALLDRLQHRVHIRGGILADDMGLGKTLSILSTIVLQAHKSGRQSRTVSIERSRQPFSAQRGLSTARLPLPVPSDAHSLPLALGQTVVNRNYQTLPSTLTRVCSDDEKQS